MISAWFLRRTDRGSASGLTGRAWKHLRRQPEKAIYRLAVAVSIFLLLCLSFAYYRNGSHYGMQSILRRRNPAEQSEVPCTKDRFLKPTGPGKKATARPCSTF